MPKLERWIVASKMVPVLDQDTLTEILKLGGNVGGGWSQIHQHIHVSSENKEAIEALLKDRGFEVSDASDHHVRHPEAWPGDGR